MQTNAAGQVVLKFKTPRRDGTTYLVMTPLELMQRLAMLIQPTPTAPASDRFAAVNLGSRMPGLGRQLPTVDVGYPDAQLGGLSGGEIAHPAVAGRPSAVGRVDVLDVGSAA